MIRVLSRPAQHALPTYTVNIYTTPVKMSHCMTEAHLDLHLGKDPETLKIKTENAVHELSEVQVHQLDQKLASLKSNFSQGLPSPPRVYWGLCRPAGLHCPSH